MSVKDSILQAGLTLLQEKGFAALTQPQVANAAGCKQSHLTYYFPTRNDLLIAIAEYSVNIILDQLCSSLSEPLPDQSFSEIISKKLIEGLPPRVILGLIVASDQDPAIREALSRLIAQVRSNIKILLGQAGLANNDEDALLFHAAMVGLAVMHQGRQNQQSEHEIEIGVNAIISKWSQQDG